MNAYKCDRCEKYYDNNDYLAEYMFATYPETSFFASKLDICTDVRIIKRIQLCEECKDKLAIFLHNGKPFNFKKEE